MFKNFKALYKKYKCKKWLKNLLLKKINLYCYHACNSYSMSQL